jgi:hypothetical protein
MFKTRFILAIALTWLFALPIFAQAEDYFLLSYGNGSNDTSGLGVFLRRIDLDSTKIIDSVCISGPGTIATEHPIQLSLNNEKYLIAVLDRTFFAKNGWMGGDQVYYKIIKVDTTLSVVKTDSFINCLTSCTDQYGNDNTFNFGIENLETHKAVLPKGRYRIDSNYNLVFIDSLKSYFDPNGIEKLNKYEYLHPFNFPNRHNLYYAGPNSWFATLRLDSTRTIILDSVKLLNGLKVSTIFAYHPKTDKLYCFYLNYECHSKFEELQKNYKQDWSTPEVLIFDPVNLELIKRDTVADFTPGNYPYMGKGLADVVGDYIVFYFYEEEMLSSLFPAMLFIFDTRTNTAKWLNVGWR